MTTFAEQRKDMQVKNCRFCKGKRVVKFVKPASFVRGRWLMFTGHPQHTCRCQVVKKEKTDVS